MHGMNPIEIAIESAGNANRLAIGIGVPAQSVVFWRNGARRIPAEYCPRIEALTNGLVRCEDLRPDVQWSVLRGNAPQSVPVGKPEEVAQSAQDPNAMRPGAVRRVTTRRVHEFDPVGQTQPIANEVA